MITLVAEMVLHLSGVTHTHMLVLLSHLTITSHFRRSAAKISGFSTYSILAVKTLINYFLEKSDLILKDFC